MREKLNTMSWCNLKPPSGILIWLSLFSMTHVITWHCTAVATLAPIESDVTFKVRHFLVLPVMAGLAEIEKDCHIHYNMLLIVWLMDHTLWSCCTTLITNATLWNLKNELAGYQKLICQVWKRKIKSVNNKNSWKTRIKCTQHRLHQLQANSLPILPLSVIKKVRLNVTS